MNKIRLKYLTNEPLQYGINIEANHYSDSGIRFLRTTDINDDGEIVGDGIYLKEEFVPANYLLKKGDLLFSRSGTIGRCYFHKTDEPMTYAGFLVRFRVKDYETAKWIYYFSKTAQFKHTLNSEAIESTIQNFNGQKYNKLSIPINNLQLTTNNYLDTQTQKITQFIAKKQRFIELLKEQRQSIINEAVTKGLNYDSDDLCDKNDLQQKKKNQKNLTNQKNHSADKKKLKNTGIEWLGDVPEHWEVRKLKYCVSLNSNENSEINNQDELIKIALENIDNWTGKYIETESEDFEGQGNLFKKGDVLFNKLRPYLAKAFITECDGISVGELLVLKPNEKYFTSQFLFQRLMTTNFIDVVNSSTYGAKMPRASWSFIGNLKLPIPPLSEQQQIVSHIKTETSTIDKAIAKTLKEIELIKEYKEAMISEAVMGKLSASGFLRLKDEQD